MKKLLDTNLFLITLFVVIFCYIISFISTDVVLSDKIYQKYLNEKYENKYNEYKDLDIDLSEFEDELKQFEQDAEDTNSYGWDYLYIDLVAITVPLFLVVLGFSGAFLVLILFHKKLHIIKFTAVLKATLLSFMVFYIPEIISAFYFLIFKKNYELKDIKEFESYFSLGKMFNKEQTPSWLWDIVSETDFSYFIFPLLVAMLLKSMYKNFSTGLLIGYSFIAYFIIYILYNTVFWYLFDLI